MGRTPRRGIVGRGRGLAAVIGALLSGCALALLTGGLPGGAQPALACGSGQPVMEANNLLATLDPNSFNTGDGLPDTGGRFNLDYVAGQSIAFTENLSYTGPGAPSLDSIKLRWKFGDDTALVDQNSPKHVYAQPGTYLVYVDYYDPTSNSWQFFDYAHIQVVASGTTSTAPQAHATADATSVYEETNVTFDAAGSKSADGAALTYTWDFNDGTRATGTHVSHAWVQPGKTLVQLIVTDAHGAKAVDTVNLNVTGQLTDVPSATLTASATTATPGSSITFDASQSQPAATQPAKLARYYWTFGDGTPQQTTTAPSVSHTYLKAGKYAATVLAVDQNNAGGDASITVTVATSAPNWMLLILLGIVLAACAVGGYFFVQSQRRYHALVRQRQQAMELARARRVTTSTRARPDGPSHRPSSRPRPPNRRR